MIDLEAMQAQFKDAFEGEGSHDRAVELLSATPPPGTLWTTGLAKRDRETLQILLLNASYAARRTQDAGLELELLERANALRRLESLMDGRLIELRILNHRADPPTVMRGLALWSKIPGFVSPDLMVKALRAAAKVSPETAGRLEQLCQIYGLHDFKRHLVEPRSSKLRK